MVAVALRLLEDVGELRKEQLKQIARGAGRDVGWRHSGQARPPDTVIASP